MVDVGPCAAEGVWDVVIFESSERYATYWSVLSFQAAGGP